jgi:rhodanese-related sulfurtransferase
LALVSERQPRNSKTTMKPGNFLRILLVSLALAGYAAWVAASRKTDGPEGPTPMAGGFLLYRTAEAEDLWRRGTALFVDVRAPAAYAAGHIDGAVSLPDEDFDRRFAELRPRLQAAATLIVYCKSPECPQGMRTALRLRDAGLSQTHLYPAGWNEWFLRGLPVARAATR